MDLAAKAESDRAYAREMRSRAAVEYAILLRSQVAAQRNHEPLAPLAPLAPDTRQSLSGQASSNKLWTCCLCSKRNSMNSILQCMRCGTPMQAGTLAARLTAVRPTDGNRDWLASGRLPRVSTTSQSSNRTLVTTPRTPVHLDGVGTRASSSPIVPASAGAHEAVAAKAVAVADLIPAPAPMDPIPEDSGPAVPGRRLTFFLFTCP